MQTPLKITNKKEDLFCVTTGERPFNCKICDMSFTTNGNMHRHMRIHEKEGTTGVSPASSIRSNSPKDLSKVSAEYLTPAAICDLKIIHHAFEKFKRYKTERFHNIIIGFRSKQYILNAKNKNMIK